jgi:class 3 adenylate cyclase
MADEHHVYVPWYEASPEGLDELAQSLNSYFVELAETVYRHRGDVLTVTGDAFSARLRFRIVLAR